MLQHGKVSYNSVVISGGSISLDCLCLEFFLYIYVYDMHCYISFYIIAFNHVLSSKVNVTLS